MFIVRVANITFGFHGGSDDKESTCNATVPGLTHGSGSSLEGNSYLLQYPYLENSMDRGCSLGVAKSQTHNYYDNDKDGNNCYINSSLSA